MNKTDKLLPSANRSEQILWVLQNELKNTEKIIIYLRKQIANINKKSNNRHPWWLLVIL